MRTLLSFTRLLPLPLLVLSATCQQRRSPVIPTMKHLEGTWLNSHEENSGDTLVYRPNTYAFPPSRGRTGFAIKSFGRFEQFDIAPTDGLTGRAGAWTIDRKTTLRINLTEGPDPSYSFEIVELDSINKVLKVRRLP
jgi:hypothetical protein